MKPLIFLSIFLISACQPGGQSKLVFEDSSIANRAPPGLQPLDYNVELQMGDRSYVESVLNQVFDLAGASATAKNEVYQSIYQRAEFGGACDLFAPSESDSGAEYDREKCVNGIGQVQIPTSNATRYSLTAKVCETLLVGSESRLSVVKNKIFSGGVWAAPDAASLTRAYKLFYPIGEPSKDVLDGFQGISAVSSNVEESWRGIILTLCISPEWQSI